MPRKNSAASLAVRDPFSETVLLQDTVITSSMPPEGGPLTTSPPQNHPHLLCVLIQAAMGSGAR